MDVEVKESTFRPFSEVHFNPPKSPVSSLRDTE